MAEIVMTYEEFLEEFEGVEVNFTSYYKHRFTYEGHHNGKMLYVEMGDSGGDIYRDYFKRPEKISKHTLLYYKVKE